MNGPLKMYRTKQIVQHDLKVQLPDCMYKLKNIHATRNSMVEQRAADHISSSTKKLDIFDQVKQFLKNNQNLPEMAALEQRQEEILKQLADLKKQMDLIRNNLKITQTSSIPTIATTTQQGTPPNIPDIIINASPTHPPYSLALIQKLWKSYVFLSVESYIHSSLSSLNEEASQLKTTLEQFTTPENVPKVNVKLIWKDVGANTELNISQRPISGEVNILRYLSRVSSDFLNYETYSNVDEIDTLLDTSYNILKSKTKTERAALLQIFSKSFGKAKFLAGRNQISIADLAAYSAIKQVTNSSEVNATLGKWLQRCAAC